MNMFDKIKRSLILSVFIFSGITLPLKATHLTGQDESISNLRSTRLVELPNDIMPLIFDHLSGRELNALWETGDKFLQYHLRRKAHIFDLSILEDQIPIGYGNQLENQKLIILYGLVQGHTFLRTLGTRFPALKSLILPQNFFNTQFLSHVITLRELQQIRGVMGCSDDYRNGNEDSHYDPQVFTRLPLLEDLSLILTPGSSVMIPSHVKTLDLDFYDADITFDKQQIYALGSLILSGSPEDALDSFLHHQGSFPHLTILKLSNLFDVSMIVRIPFSMPSLTELYLESCEDGIDDEGTIFNMISSIPHLNTLSLLGAVNQYSMSVDFINWAKGMQYLKHLSLSGAVFPEDMTDLEIFEILGNLPSLQVLFVHNFNENIMRLVGLLPGSLIDFTVEDVKYDLSSIHHGKRSAGEIDEKSLPITKKTRKD